MIELGKRQNLSVIKKVDFGVYLADGGEKEPEEQVLLPARQVPEHTRVGDELSVFIYRDSMDRLIATVKEPLLEIGQTAVLRVADTGRVGAFMDWGLEKDLLLPFSEQIWKVKKGDRCLVALYEDKSSRLCATMNVYPYLRTDSPYRVDDMVKGMVYEVNKQLGVFIAVDSKYSALIPSREAQGRYQVGDELELRVTKVKDNGKLNVSARKKAYLQMDEDAVLLLKKLKAGGGVLPLDDKSAPDKIRNRLGISKAAFKRAAGRLLKEGQIQMEPGKIRLCRQGKEA